jgi:hypothetical protein
VFKKFLMMSAVVLLISSCVNSNLRMPSSAAQVYFNTDIQQSLMLAAQNNILIHIPDSTTREFEKSEIDKDCRKMQEPLWAEKLSQYLNEFRKRPELLNRIHVIELKRADKSNVSIQRDLDGAVTLSLQFVKFENYEKIGFQTRLPCKASLAEYLGRDLIKTNYEFPDLDKMVLTLQNLPERREIPRFKFNNEFLIYLAERGTILKFTHELSFEKTSQGKFIMPELLNRLAAEVKPSFHQHMNYWLKQINQMSLQAELVQFFSLIPNKDLKAGVRVDSRGELTQKVLGDSDLTYLFLSYNVENENLMSVSIEQLESCLKSFTEDMTGLKLRKPAASDRESYLKPGYFCTFKPSAR